MRLKLGVLGQNDFYRVDLVFNQYCSLSLKKWNVKGDKDSTPDFASSEAMEEILVKFKPE